MIQRPSNWSEIKEFSGRAKLPAGAYICRIMRAEVENNSYGDRLAIYFDIEDGEFAGYFDDDYNSNTRANKKWRGVYKPFLPKNDGSEKDEWTKAVFKGLITSVEKSNRGYVWDWNELSLSGKVVGIIFRSEEWSFNDRHGWSARPFRACSVDSVQDGTYTVPKEKALADSSSSASAYSAFSEAEDDNEELPF